VFGGAGQQTMLLHNIGPSCCDQVSHTCSAYKIRLEHVWKETKITSVRQWEIIYLNCALFKDSVNSSNRARFKGKQSALQKSETESTDFTEKFASLKSLKVFFSYLSRSNRNKRKLMLRPEGVLTGRGLHFLIGLEVPQLSWAEAVPIKVKGKVVPMLS
jgi:hypothetical protein